MNEVVVMGNGLWNIQRHSKKYWISLAVINLPIAFWIVLYERKGLLNKVLPGDVILRYFGAVTNDFFMVSIIILDIVIMILGILFVIAIYNYLMGRIVKYRVYNNDKLFQFIYSTITIFDIIIVVPVIFGNLYCIYKIFLFGFPAYLRTYELRDVLHLDASDMLFIIIFILNMVYGIIGLFDSLLPFKQYINSAKEVGSLKNLFYDNVWLSVSNDDRDYSTFSLLPGRLNEENIYTYRDIERLRVEKGIDIDTQRICKYIIYLTETECADDVRVKLSNISKKIFARCVVLLSNKSAENVHKNIIHELKNNINAEIIYNASNIYSIDKLFLYIQNKDVFGNVGMIEIEKFNKDLIGVLNGIYSGPTIASEFVRHSLEQLDLLSGFKALFNYIDLQYRLVIAFLFGEDTEWYSKDNNAIKIGNVTKMRRLLVNLKLEKKLDKEAVIPKEYDLLIEKYLFGYLVEYSEKEQFGIDDVSKLSALLRNELIGHDTFEKRDLKTLYNIVLRLALATNYLLETNDMTVYYIENDIVVGDFRQYKKKCLSPFLILDKGQLLVFNDITDNGSKEYLNFLNGELMTPSYHIV